VTGLTAAETVRRDALAERLLDSLLGSFDLLAIHLGLETYAREAGFTRFAVLPIEHDSLRLYRLDP
jgi:hypothetical protein